METFRSLLFPFDWQSLYVPILPAALTGCLEAPGGYMIGMAVTAADMEAGTIAIARCVMYMLRCARMHTHLLFHSTGSATRYIYMATIDVL
jgi:DENN (AEX-3) domain